MLPIKWIVINSTISTVEGVKSAKELNCTWLETSVKDDLNIKSLFEKIIEELVFNIDTQLITPGSHNVIQIYHNGFMFEFEENF